MMFFYHNYISQKSFLTANPLQNTAAFGNKTEVPQQRKINDRSNKSRLNQIKSALTEDFKASDSLPDSQPQVQQIR